MTTPELDAPEDNENGLRERAQASRARLLDTLDALERRGARLVATAHDMRKVVALFIDVVAAVGAISSLVAVAVAGTRSSGPHAPRPRPRVLSRLALVAVFAGVAYVARRNVGGGGRRGTSRSPLRAVS